MSEHEIITPFVLPWEEQRRRDYFPRFMKEPTYFVRRNFTLFQTGMYEQAPEVPVDFFVGINHCPFPDCQQVIEDFYQCFHCNVRWCKDCNIKKCVSRFFISSLTNNGDVNSTSPLPVCSHYCLDMILRSEVSVGLFEPVFTIDPLE